MWKSIDVPSPDGTTHADFSLGRGAIALWVVAGVVFLVALFLVADIVWTWRRNRLRMKPGSSRIRFTYARKFLAWLFYPSFQAILREDD